MDLIQRTSVRRYGVAIVSSAVALALTLLFEEDLERTVFIFFFAGVVVSATFGGFRAGLLAALVGVVSVDYIFLNPRQSLLMDGAGIVQILIFLFIAIVISVLSESRSRASRRAGENREWLATTIRSIGDAVIATDAAGRVTFMNAVAQELTGWPEQEASGRPLADIFTIVNEETRLPVESPVEKVLQQGIIVGLANHTVLIARNGREIPIEDSAAPIRDSSDRLAGVIMVFHDVSERRKRELEQQFLYESGELLGSSLDYELTLSRLAHQAVPRIADWCAVDILDENGELRRLAVAHVDENKIAWAHELQQRYPADPESAAGLHEVIRSGRSAFFPEISEAMLQAAARDPEHLALMRRIGFTSAIIVPLALRDRVLGAITLVYAESARHYDRMDLALAEELARKAALAIENAHLYRDIHEQREWFRVTLGSIGDAVIATDTESRVTFMNPVARALTGWNDDGIGRELALVFNIVNEHTRQPVESPVAKVLREGRIVGLANHTVLIGRDGTEVPIDDSAAPIRDSSGQIQGVVMVFHDITARKAAENERDALFDEVRSQRERLNNLIASVPGVVWEAWGEPDVPSQRIDFVSDYVEKMLGYSAAEWLGTPNFWLTVVHPDDQERAAREAAAIFESGRGGESRFRWLTRDREVRWIEARSTVIIGADGRPAGMRGVSMDITAQKIAEDALRESEARFRTMADSAPVLIWMTGSEGGRTYFNRTWLEFTGRTQEQEQGSGWMSGIHQDDMDGYSDISSGAFRTQEPFRLEYRLRHAGGEYRWLLDSGVPRFSSDGAFAGYIGSCIDITDRKRIESQLKEAKEAAEAANRAKDQFLAVLSHELRTPLTPVLATAQALESDAAFPDDFRPLVEIIRRNVELEVHLIDDLLDLVRVAKGKIQIHQEVVSLHDLLEKVLEICRSDIYGKKLQLNVELHAGEHLVRGDAPRLQQVFWNLLKNAVKFTPSGGSVTLRSINPHPGRVAVAVIDTGIGIEPDVLPRIFNAFEQGERTITRQFGGLGLGLAITKGLVDLHGGTLLAESAGRNTGTTFTVELGTVAAVPAPAVAAGRNPPETPAARNGHIRILIVDDHEDTNNVLKLLLERRGYQVKSAASVRAALEVAGEHEFDLLVSDIGLPDGSGHDLVRELIARRAAAGQPPLKAIALSGFGMEGDIQKSHEAGFSDHLTKPVTFQKLQDIIGRMFA